MSEFPLSSQIAGARSGAVVDAGLRAHMQRVYNRMTAGLAITFITSFLASHSASVMGIILNPAVSLVLIFSPLALIWFGFNPRTMSSDKLRATFGLLSVLYGLSFSVIFMVYVPADITRALLMTAAMFAGISIFGYTTKRDLAPLGVFCIMGMFGLLAFALINMIGVGFGLYAASPLMSNIVALASIVIFAGLTAWETQATKEMYHISHGEEGNSRLAWMAALNLYISFIALFQNILHLIGNRE